MSLHRCTRILAATGAAAALALAGCSTDDGAEDAAGATEATTATATSAGESEEAAAGVTLEDGYIKEKPADKPMTAIFGTLVNNTDADVEVTGFRVEGLAEGTVFEQHEVADGVMRKIDGGHTIPAGGSHELVPGGDHLMIMNNDEALEPGAEYTVVIELSDGSELTIDLPVRVQPSGEENYGDIEGHEGYEEGMDHGDMDHGDMDHGDMGHGADN